MFRNSISRILTINSRHGFKTTASLNGGGHHAPAKAIEDKNLLSKIKAWCITPDHPKLHQGYLYREMGNLQGAMSHTGGKFILTMAWFFLFYMMWSHPENFWGHAPYPDTAEWTDKELGINAYNMNFFFSNFFFYIYIL